MSTTEEERINKKFLTLPKILLQKYNEEGITPTFLDKLLPLDRQEILAYWMNEMFEKGHPWDGIIRAVDNATRKGARLQLRKRNKERRMEKLRMGRLKR